LNQQKSFLFFGRELGLIGVDEIPSFSGAQARRVIERVQAIVVEAGEVRDPDVQIAERRVGRCLDRSLERGAVWNLGSSRRSESSGPLRLAFARAGLRHEAPRA